MLRHNCDNATPLVPVVDIVITQGADFDIQFEFLDGNDDTPIDISNYKFYASIKESANDDIAVAKMHQVAVDPKKGIVNLSLSAEETGAINTSGNSYRDWEELYWDANVFDGHNVRRICNGKAFISPCISRGGNT